MKTKIERKIHIIDVTNKSLGRVASQIAVLLRGKHKPNFMPHLDMGDFVRVKNVEKLKITGNKMRQKIYYSHSGYPGGLKKRTLQEVFNKEPFKVLKWAVYGMLPKNKLRKIQIKRLIFGDN